MVSVIEVFNAVQDQIHAPQNGELTYDDFNLRSKIAELKMLGWLTGNPDAGVQGPTPYDNQKSRDWLTPLIKTIPLDASEGKIIRPDDYYQYENSYVVIMECGCTDKDICKCDIEDTKKKRFPVDMLEGQQFYNRVNTNIKLEQPSLKKPIAKQKGKKFEFYPEDIGTVELEYISYPSQYGKIVGMIDKKYNQEVPDLSLSKNYVWDDWALDVLAWFIVDGFANRTRDTTLKNMNSQTGKLP